MSPFSRNLALTVTLLILAGCRIAPEAADPMPARVLAEPAHADTLLLLLPGIGDRMEDFRDHGFGQAVAEHQPRWRAVAADAHLGYYRERSLTRRLGELIDRQLVPGIDSVLLAGISLGGMGGLLHYCDTRDPRIDSILLLAPYLGEPELIEEIRAAGGPEAWRPDDPEASPGTKLWHCLKTWPDEGPTLYLAYGDTDRLANGHRLLAGQLPPERVLVLPGRHRWATWERLWDALLGRIERQRAPESRG